MNIRLLFVLGVILLIGAVGPGECRAEDDPLRRLELLPPNYWMGTEVSSDSLAAIRSYYHQRGSELRKDGTNSYVVGTVLVAVGGFILSSAIGGPNDKQSEVVWPALGVIGGGGFFAMRGRSMRQKGNELEDWGQALDVWAAQRDRTNEN
jgi:hypothetical protein